ncbi:molybdopterin molybdotransferase [Paenibacillus endophyticus]|uniref:Molybdopterin molybdenumtransferase n=1 Tax=Paenibacillus endophyticus TaxID=1294268 RepID=A0A7W5CCQ7_9BACL|nr:gephyrin-like molybdotransferase Glp [Paenibacillus endophyticus]MBB3154815.1 molybdopterin molybdotransferase [Paenibacillus endophyticus]
MVKKHSGMNGQGSRFNRRAVRVEEAQRRVLEAAAGQVVGSELVALHESGGRRLAQTVTASSDWPPFARSGLDGYAVRAADIAEASPEKPAELRVVYEVAAGQVAPAALQAGTAARIMTGAAVPEGADAVVMLEQTAEAMLAYGSRAVLIKRAGAAGQHIAPCGEEFRRGGVLAVPGTLVRPGHVALLGTFGYAEVAVRKRPRIAVFATGSELLAVAAQLAPGRVRDSNSSMVAAMVHQSGAEPLLLGALPDELAAVEAALAEAWESSDIIVTTGGVSVGDYDVMAELIRAFKDGSGVRTKVQLSSLQSAAERPASRLLFDKVAMRPGSPTSAAVIDGKLLFALSGNPGACFVGFELFVRPAIHLLLGVREALPTVVRARLLTAVEKPSPHDRFVRARLVIGENGMLSADPLAFAKSSMMASIAEAEGLVIIPAGSKGAEVGEAVDVILIP